jgi:3-dehydroquinate synthase
MVQRRERTDAAGMTTELHRVRDAVPLPADGDPLMACAERRDRYPIHVTTTMEALVGHLTDALGDSQSLTILTDESVDALFGPTLVRALRSAGYDPLVRAIPAGEPSKSLDQAVAMWHWLAESGAARRDVLVAFGGGVIADLGGWVASAYMRGIPYVNLPTTLLAQVDGALGGKVAVNHPLAKNLIGAFHQPAAVIANVGFLASISGRHLRAGLAEAIKKAMIASPAYWAYLEEHADAILAREPAALERLVRCAAAIKTALVQRDPYEIDLRRPLNFGHTIGHPLETVTGYGPLLHGEAVALGMVVEARIATARGLMATELLERLLALLRRCDLPTTASDLAAPVSGPEIVAAMEHVRLIRAGSLRYVLPVDLGETVIADDVAEDEVRCALRDCGVPFPAAVVR